MGIVPYNDSETFSLQRIYFSKANACHKYLVTSRKIKQAQLFNPKIALILYTINTKKHKIIMSAAVFYLTLFALCIKIRITNLCRVRGFNNGLRRN